MPQQATAPEPSPAPPAPSRGREGSFAWKLQRLRSMSPAELAWRVEQRLALRRLARRAGQAVPALRPPPAGFRAALIEATGPLVPWAASGAATAEERAAFERAFPGEAARTIALADAVLAGRIELFARTYALGPDPRAWPWNRSADDGPPVPLDFGPTLDYREPELVGDARLAWELGRHGYLAPLAQAAWLTGEARYGTFAFAVLEAWIEACPPYRGIQWVSALEFALRSLSWGFALAVVARGAAGAAIDDARWERVLATWAEQLRFVHAHDARFSSANNHRLGEAAGLAWGGIALAFLPEGAEWRRRGFAILDECVLAQTTDDGVTREHAFAYQLFVLDFVVAVHAAGARAGQPLPPPVRARLSAVAAALERLAPGGRVWPVGDGDEGQALALGEPLPTRAAASLEAAFALLGEAAPGAQAHPRRFWLGLPAPAAASAAPPKGVTRHGGYVIDAWATPRGEARLLFDTAEMGLPPLYAHGHADALQVLLDVDGPRLVDPGTGAYHARPDLREWLRSTAAHNTIELDARSQSEPGGLFQWLRVARVFDRVVGAGAASGAGGDAIDAAAAHDGYARTEGVVHRRRVRREGATVVRVTDTLESVAGRGSGADVERRVVLRWHVGDGRPRLSSPDRVEVTWPDGFALALCVRSPAGGHARIAEDGLWAPRFLEPRPCGVVEWIVETTAGCTIETAIVLGGGTFSFTAPAP